MPALGLLAGIADHRLFAGQSHARPARVRQRKPQALPQAVKGRRDHNFQPRFLF